MPSCEVKDASTQPASGRQTDAGPEERERVWVPRLIQKTVVYDRGSGPSGSCTVGLPPHYRLPLGLVHSARDNYRALNEQCNASAVSLRLGGCEDDKAHSTGTLPLMAYAENYARDGESGCGDELSGLKIDFQ